MGKTYRRSPEDDIFDRTPNSVRVSRRHISAANRIVAMHFEEQLPKVKVIRMPRLSSPNWIPIIDPDSNDSTTYLRDSRLDLLQGFAEQAAEI